MIPESKLLGRTNRTFPSLWLRLAVPPEPRDESWPDDLCRSARACGVPIDVSSQPALWGGLLRAHDGVLMATGGIGIRRATNDRQAADLVQAELIQLLSAIGRDYVDLFFLQVREPPSEHQIDGALEALETARQEGHIRHIGLQCSGPPHATLGAWQFHDVFEALLLDRGPEVREAYDMLVPIAQQRRVGVVAHWLGSGADDLTSRGEAWTREQPLLLTVRTPAEVDQAVRWAEGSTV